MGAISQDEITTSTPSSSTTPPTTQATWTVNDKEYTLHTITLPGTPTSSPPIPPTSIACLISPRLIPLLPSPPPPAIPLPTDTSTLTSQSKCYTIRATPNKGIAMFAARDIRAGELIVCEHPALILPAGKFPTAAYDALPYWITDEGRREAVLGMGNCRTREECESPVEGIVKTNAMMLELDPKAVLGEVKRPGEDLYGGVYPVINRANHSCGPNGGVKWTLSALTLSLYALRAIPKGQEITKTYIDPALPRHERIEHLLRNYRFKCDCPWCDIRGTGEGTGSVSVVTSGSSDCGSMRFGSGSRSTLNSVRDDAAVSTSTSDSTATNDSTTESKTLSTTTSTIESTTDSTTSDSTPPSTSSAIARITITITDPLTGSITSPNSNPENFTPSELTLIAQSNTNRALLGSWIPTHLSYKKWSRDLSRSDDLIVAANLHALSLIEKEGMQGLQNLFVEELALCCMDLGDVEGFRKWGGMMVELGRVEDPEAGRRFEGLVAGEVEAGKKWGWRRKQRMQQSKKRAEITETETLTDSFQLLFHNSDMESDFDPSSSDED